MLVNGQNLTTIWFDEKEGLVKVIDQRLLPHKLKIVNLNNLSDSIPIIEYLPLLDPPSTDSSKKLFLFFFINFKYAVMGVSKSAEISVHKQNLLYFFDLILWEDKFFQIH